MLLRCLKKDPKHRLQAIGDARIQLDELMSGSAEPATASQVPTRSVVRRAAPAALGALAASLLTGALVMWVGPEGAVGNPPPVSRFEIVLPPGHALASDFSRAVAISRDGQYVASSEAGRQLAVRAIDWLETRRLGGTDQGRRVVRPWFEELKAVREPHPRVGRTSARYRPVPEEAPGYGLVPGRLSAVSKYAA